MLGGAESDLCSFLSIVFNFYPEPVLANENSKRKRTLFYLQAADPLGLALRALGLRIMRWQQQGQWGQ
jgi:hypothetical protein